MPTIMRTTPDVEELFTALAVERGLDAEKMPTAVRMAVAALGRGATPFTMLLEDLPASANAWAWMAVAFTSFATWCDGTIVTDEEMPND